MFKKEVKKHGKLRKESHKKIKEIEKALFDIDSTAKEADKADKHLLQKAEPNPKSHANHRSPHAKSSHQKVVSVTYNPRTIERIISAVVILLLLFFFFYNPFYDMFPWNKETSDIQIEEIAVQDSDQSVVEKEVELVVGDTSDDEDAIVEEEPEKIVEEEVTEEDEVVAEEEDTNETTEGSEAELGEVNFEILNVETEKTDWGWKIKEVSFKIDNNRGNFRPKVRVRSLADSVTGEQHGDQTKVLPILAIGKSLTDSIDARSSFVDDVDQAYIIVKLVDEGSSTGSAGDVSLKEVRQKVSAP